MSDPATSPHFVSHGPPGTYGGASDWCSATCRTDIREQHIAPGAVVLCKRGTTELHPEATRYAREAWATYGRYLAAITPALAASWVPEPVVTPHGSPVKWKRSEYRVTNRHTAPGFWRLVYADGFGCANDEYYAELEWAKLAKTHKRSTGNGRLTYSNTWARPDFMPPAPVLTDAIVQGMNKYNRRAKTTAKERAEGLAKIRRPVQAVAS